MEIRNDMEVNPGRRDRSKIIFIFEDRKPIVCRRIMGDRRKRCIGI